jgi:hypothetical protein
VCPPRRAQRKGVVEKNIDFLTRRWWRTAGVVTVEDAKRRWTSSVRPSVTPAPDGLAAATVAGWR